MTDSQRRPGVPGCQGGQEKRAGRMPKTLARPGVLEHVEVSLLSSPSLVSLYTRTCLSVRYRQIYRCMNSWSSSSFSKESQRMEVNRPDHRKRCDEWSCWGLAAQRYDIIGVFFFCRLPVGEESDNEQFFIQAGPPAQGASASTTCFSDYCLFTWLWSRHITSEGNRVICSRYC